MISPILLAAALAATPPAPSTVASTARPIGPAAPARPAIEPSLAFGASTSLDRSADIAAIARTLEEYLSDGTGPSWQELADVAPAEILLPALGRVLVEGRTRARLRAARVLGTSKEPLAALVLLDAIPRETDASIERALVLALKPWRQGDRRYEEALDEPVSEGWLWATLESLGRTRDSSALPVLTRLLETWPGHRLPLIRAIARIGDPSSIPTLRGLVGQSNETDAEAIGALALLGVDYAENRGRLVRALPRASERGHAGLQACRSILHYLREIALARSDAEALVPLFYVVTHGPEPSRSDAMTALHRVCAQRPQLFLTAMGMISPTDQDEFVPHLVAFVFARDTAWDFIKLWKKAFPNLDLENDNMNLVYRVRRALENAIP